MKLEEIVGYLPHKLKIKYKQEFGHVLSMSCTIETVRARMQNKEDKSWNNFILSLKKIKPILRPLSDLTKPIVVDGKEFVPIEEIFYWELCEFTSLEKKDLIFGTGITEESNLRFVYLLDDNNDIEFDFSENIRFLPYKIIQLLYKWHFDIHGLIEKGEAIDINEVEI